jgi:3-hydroxyacyl-CoA dehydrogenase
MESTIGLDDVEVLIVGTGLMGASLAQAFAQNGLTVGLIGRRQEGLDKALTVIGRSLAEAEEKGLFNKSQAESVRARIIPGLELETACRKRNLRLVIESVSESLTLKLELLSWLDEFCPAKVVLSTNTSCLDAEVLAAQIRRPDRFLWLHFFFPAHKIRAAEYSALSQTSEQAVRTAAECLEKARRTAVRLLRYRKGGTANVIFVALVLEAVRQLEEGFGAEAVDEAARAAFAIPSGFISLLGTVSPRLAVSCLESFSEPAVGEHPFHLVYHNFFAPPEQLKARIEEARRSGVVVSLEGITAPNGTVKPADFLVVEFLKRRFLAVAFATAAEVVEAGLIRLEDLDRLCQAAFSWPAGPFALMNDVGVGAALKMVTEKMELSHRHEINFPVPRLLIEQAQKNEPWPVKG